MKKPRRLAALLCLLAVHALPARAQSSLTLYGIADLGARHVRNDGAGSGNLLSSGNASTSRVGLRGREDLGDGLHAGFELEAGLALDTGATASSSRFFDRAAYASLGSRSLGELRLGRDEVPTYPVWSRIDPFGNAGAAGVGNLLDAGQPGPLRAAFGSGADPLARTDNALQWRLPEGPGGLQGGVMAAAGEGGRAEDGRHRLVGARIGYASGPAYLAAATARTTNDRTGGLRFDDDIVGGSYDLGFATLGVAWRQFRLAAARETHTLLAATVPLGAGRLRLSWQRVRPGGSVGATPIAPGGASKVGVGYLHGLSKRTALYVTVVHIDNRGGSTYAVAGAAGGPTPGGASKAAEAGVRVSF